MEFRILGPLEVVAEGRPVSIRRGKELALLAYLLLHANEIVPRERLIDQLWDERPPATAAKILHNAVSHLRKQLGNGRLVTREPGYLLRVADEELDLQRFERLAREGRHEEALALWRGPPLLDLRDERFADEARRRLEEQRLGVLEDRIEADLAAGRDAELVPELENLIAAHPLREGLYAALMRALYRAGRQADALDTYRRARTALSHELGLEPGPQLRELERKILEQDPELAAPARPRAAAARRWRLRWLVAAAVGLVGAAAAVTAFITRNDAGGPLVAPPNSLVAIDPGSNRVEAVVPVGETPRGLAVDQHGVWVANAGEGTLSRIDPRRFEVVQTIGLGAQAVDVAAAPSGIWIATGIDDGLIQVHPTTSGVLRRLRLPRAELSDAAHAVAARDGGVWAGSGGLLIAIDAQTGEIRPRAGTRSLGDGVQDIAVGAAAVWVAESVNQVIRLSLTRSRVTGRASLEGTPLAVAVGYGSVWVSMQATSPQGFNTVAEIDPVALRLRKATVVPGRPEGIALGAGGVWVADFDAGTVMRLDPKSASITATIRVGGHPFGLAFGAGRVWVTVT